MTPEQRRKQFEAEKAEHAARRAKEQAERDECARKSAGASAEYAARMAAEQAILDEIQAAAPEYESPEAWTERMSRRASEEWRRCREAEAEEAKKPTHLR